MRRPRAKTRGLAGILALLAASPAAGADPTGAPTAGEIRIVRIDCKFAGGTHVVEQQDAEDIHTTRIAPSDWLASDVRIWTSERRCHMTAPFILNDRVRIFFREPQMFEDSLEMTRVGDAIICERQGSSQGFVHAGSVIRIDAVTGAAVWLDRFGFGATSDTVSRNYSCDIREVRAVQQ